MTLHVYLCTVASVLAFPPPPLASRASAAVLEPAELARRSNAIPAATVASRALNTPTLTFLLGAGAFLYALLLLLCYKKWVPQQGQPLSRRSRTCAIVIRKVAIDHGLCLALRTGSTAGPEMRRDLRQG